MHEPRNYTARRIHNCPSLPRQGVSIHLDRSSKLLRETPTWRLEVRREANEADLEENHLLENTGDSIWITALEIAHCPYCGARLEISEGAQPDDLGRFVHLDCSRWRTRLQ